MIIIVEGPDGAGKSTVAKELAANYNAALIHTGPPRRDEPAVIQYLGEARHYMVQPNDTVLDRFHLGERVYGPILRQQDTLGDIGQRQVERMLMSRGFACVVLCIPPFETCYKNWHARRETELFTDYGLFVKTFTAFKDIRTTLPLFRYDYTQETPLQLIESIEKARRI